ncbi:short chain dehydrogenase [Sporosarcina sp. P21c]|uniref:SDR family NAD(P)-dependent oxidoreductase n=1 Tax=Sporosarcina TaxID=1569 RepID=UPI000A157756|nr:MULTISPECIES: SDR family oxidoreductase [Sporosarcina]ARJ38302.1 short-chain dehydrogenase [Sporosarcina ureae]PIC82978.1 short chain dehydrogenase [Sporosarcina sp. P1]PIC90185.1 short chain dehydrogenase [Sporosarcina sp. P21c]
MIGIMEGKAGLVTASGSGIGRATAVALAKAGAKVMISDVSEETGHETVQIIKDLGGEAAFFKCDVSDEEQVIQLVNKTVETFGKLDFAHNNAGINKGQKPIGELDSKDWDITLKVNLYGTFYCIKHEVNAMLKTGGGAIVNTSSGSGLQGSPNMAPYTASKHAITGLTKSVALEYGQKGITINSIAPGATITPAIENWSKTSTAQYEAVLASLPAGRMSTAEEQANAVVFLCSDLARSISGVTLAVDGGYTAGNMQQ